MNRKYTLKHILFALREEYLELEKQLKELENYVIINGDIDDISFRVHDFNFPKTIDIYLKKRQTLLDKIAEIIGFVGIYTRGVVFWNVPKEIDAACYWKRTKVCSISDMEEFTKSINDILESDFVKNTYLAIPRGDHKYSLTITSSTTTLHEKRSDFSSISYNSKYNSININRRKNNITPDYIDNIFNITFNRGKFNDYYKSIFDNYEDKEIDIIDSFDSNHSQLEIIEEPKKLILKPKKSI